jgi:hypothetical protein
MPVLAEGINRYRAFVEDQMKTLKSSVSGRTSHSVKASGVYSKIVPCATPCASRASRERGSLAGIPLRPKSTE